MKIKRAEGYGQAQCELCRQNNKWMRSWVTLLFEIEGRPGLYCSGCVERLKKQEQKKEGD